MKQAYMFTVKETLSDLFFGLENKIKIEEIISIGDDEILFIVSGDELPDECGDKRQKIKLIVTKDVVVVDGKGYYKLNKEIKLFK